MKAAFLIRCSTKKQDYSRQVNDLTRLAKRLGYEYGEDTIYGEHITGKDDFTVKDRESIRLLKEAAAQKKFDVILVSEVSRMSRDIASGTAYVRQLTNMEIPVYFKDIDTWTIDPHTGHKLPEAELSITNAFIAAWKYIRSMKTQIASGRRNELENNQVSVGRPFFGYKRTQSKDKEERNRIIVDEALAPIVKDVFETYLKDGATLKSTAIAMTAKYKEITGRNFTIGTIEHILTYEPYSTGILPIYLGDPDDPNFVESRKKNKYDTTYAERFDVEIPQLIDRELWEQATAKRKANKVASEPYPKQRTYLLSKLLKCPCCGYTMTPRKKAEEERDKDGKFKMRKINGADALSWVCMSGVNSATDCDNRISIANEKLEPIIWGLIKEHYMNLSDIFIGEKEDRLSKLKDKQSSLNTEIINFENHISEQQKSINRAVDVVMRADTAILDIVTAKLNDVTKKAKKEIADAELRIAACNTEIENVIKQIDLLENQEQDYELQKKADSDPALKRSIIREIVQKIIPHKITTFKSRIIDGRGKFRYEKELKNGVVLLEVHTLFGIIYVLYNSNDKGEIREAYFMNETFATFQNGTAAFEAYERGEYFVVTFPSLVGESEEIVEFIDVNKFKGLCELNRWVIRYEYKTGKIIPLERGYPFNDLQGFTELLEESEVARDIIEFREDNL